MHGDPPKLPRIARFGSRSRHHAIESMIFRLSYFALVSASSSVAISWLRPRVHEAASTTIGSFRHRSSAHGVGDGLGHELVALGIAFRLPRGGAAQAGDIRRNPQRLSGAFG